MYDTDELEDSGCCTLPYFIINLCNVVFPLVVCLKGRRGCATLSEAQRGHWTQLTLPPPAVFLPNLEGWLSCEFRDMVQGDLGELGDP